MHDLPRKLLNFNRKYRLVRKQDFEFVFAKPSKSTRHSLLALYRPNTLAHPRLGIIVGKRHIRTAVVRNRCRRVIRESFRQFGDQLGGLDIVVMVRTAIPALSKAAGKQTLRHDIDTLWQALTPKASSPQD